MVRFFGALLGSAFIAALVVADLMLYVAHAQQPTPTEQAMGNKIVAEVQAGLNCGAELIVVKAELAKTESRGEERRTPACHTGEINGLHQLALQSLA